MYSDSSLRYAPFRMTERRNDIECLFISRCKDSETNSHTPVDNGGKRVKSRLISFQKFFLHISRKDIYPEANEQSKKRKRKLNIKYQHNFIRFFAVNKDKVFNFARNEPFVDKTGKDKGIST